jgi:hypothetical protein
MRCSVITLSDNRSVALGLSFFLLSNYRNLEYRIVQFKHRVSDSCPSLHAIQREKQLTVERAKKRSSAVPCLLFFFLSPLYPIPSFITPTSKPLFLSSLPRFPNKLLPVLCLILCFPSLVLFSLLLSYSVLFPIFLVFPFLISFHQSFSLNC